MSQGVCIRWGMLVTPLLLGTNAQLESLRLLWKGHVQALAEGRVFPLMPLLLLLLLLMT